MSTESMHIPKTLVLENDGAAREFTIDFCRSAVCHCREVSLVERLPTNPPGQEPRRITVDPFVRKWVATSGDVPAEDLDGRAWGEAIQPSQWSALSGAFMACKEQAIAEFDPTREQVMFDFRAIDRGEMVGYSEIFPFASMVEIERGEKRYLIDTQHCARPGCDCTEAVLSFIENTVGQQGEVTPVAILSVDHQTGQWSNAETGGPLRGFARELSDLVMEQVPDALIELGRQQRLLRRLYRNSLPLRPPVERTKAAPAKVGRNAPCPCGSGKKHKKCCAAR